MTKLYILCGIPFSGKSTLAKTLVERCGFVRIDLDEIKFELYGSNITDKQLQQSDWDKIYQEMYERIENELIDGQTVVHDTGNFTKYERKLVIDIANKLNVEFTTIFINTPKEVARERLLQNRKMLQRFDVSDQAFEEAVAEMEGPVLEENCIEFNVHENVDEWIRKNIIED